MGVGGGRVGGWMLVRSGLEVGREGDEGDYEGCSCWGFQRCRRGAGLVGVGGSGFSRFGYSNPGKGCCVFLVKVRYINFGPGRITANW